MKATDLIGLSIISMRYHYAPENAVGLQEFHTYLNLSNGHIATIPVWPNEEFQTGKEEKAELLHQYISGKEFPKPTREKVEGQMIQEIHFRKENSLFSKPAFLELSNGYYLTEEIYASSDFEVSLKLLSKEEFLQEEGWEAYTKGKGRTP